MVIDDVFSVIAEATRREILQALATEHKSVGQLVDELGASQPTISKHLRVLREAGLVTMRAQGQKRFYSLDTAPLEHIVQWLDGVGATPPVAVAAGTSVAAGLGSAGAAGNYASSNGGNVSHIAAVTGSPLAAPAGTNNAGVPARVRPAAALQQRGAGMPQSHPPVRSEVVHTPVVVRAAEPDGTMPQQFTRSVGRAANKAADLLANLPKRKFGRRKE